MMNNTNEDDREIPISEGEPIQGLPGWVRLVFAVLAILLLLTCTVLIAAYVKNPATIPSPRELQLNTLIIAGLAILFLALVPWHKLGLRIRKIGAIEFERVVNTQASEHAVEFAELRVRIDELEEKMRGVDEISPISEAMAVPTLRPLLLDFLDKHQPTPYSPLRIREWGSRQQEFEQLKDYEVALIRRMLQALVAEGKVATRVSKLGNTLYKVVD